MTLLVFYICLAIGASFLCSVLEAVFLSITPSYIALLKTDQPDLAERLHKLKANVDKPLAAILSLNTVAHTVGAAGAGAQAAAVFGDAVIAVFSAILTFLILVLSEIIPKTLGALYWRRLTPFVSRVLPVLILSMWPLVKMSEWITKLMAPKGKRLAISREEIIAMTDVGEKIGVVAEKESIIIRNLLRFDALTVQDIMTPRTVVHALPQSMSVKDALADLDDFRFSRIPIYGDTIDQVVGFVLRYDLLAAALKGEDGAPLENFKRDLMAIAQSEDLQLLFERLLEQERHIVLVTDDYGGTAGVATLEDVVETMLGMEIVDEHDTIEDLQVLARERWSVRAKKMGIVLEETERA